MQRTQLIRRPRYNPTMYNPVGSYSLLGDNPATQILIIALVALVIYLYLRNSKTSGPIMSSSTTEVRQITWNTDGLPTKIVTSHV